MSSDDLLKIVALLFGGGGPIAALFLAYKAGCDQCCRERDEYRKANDAALTALRKRDEELYDAWRRQPTAGNEGRP